ncbi:Helicase conserved C-terminal domain [Ceratobasidium sp. AG-Ba]|nr:Helicase conserved C-terminal domain [Ceratobasidium sp. AG-Ba]
MAPVNLCFAPMYYRWTTSDAIPEYDPANETSNDIWDSFPLNSVRFCDILGIKVREGFSRPPSGENVRLSEKLKREWSKHVRGARRFLVSADKAVRDYLLSTSSPSFERIQDQILNSAPELHHWRWVVENTLNVAGGFNQEIESIMKDSECNAEFGFMKLRAQERAKHCRKGKETETVFRAKDVKTGNRYDDVFPQARHMLMEKLFGDDAFFPQEPMDKDDDQTAFADQPQIHNQEYYGITRALTARAYERGMGRIERALTAVRKGSEEIQAAYEAANQDLTDERLAKLIRTFCYFCEGVRLESASSGGGKEAESDEVKYWRKKIDSLMASLGRTVEDGKIVRIDATLAVQHGLDAEMEDDDDVKLDSDRDQAEEQAAARAFNMGFEPDAGVEHLRSKIYADLCKGWGLVDGKLPGGRKERKATWHQLIAATEIMTRAFVDPSDPHAEPRPTLLADEVGLGKTGTIIVALQLLWHLIELQDLEGAGGPAWPPILGELYLGLTWWGRLCLATYTSYGAIAALALHLAAPYLAHRKKTSFMGLGPIPRLPSVFIVPTTLRIQYGDEIKTWLEDKQYELLVYRGTESARKKFMADSSPYRRALASQRPERTLVIVESPTLMREYGDLRLPAGMKDTAEVPMEFYTRAAKSLIGQQSLMGVVDESHSWRNFNTKYRAGLAIMSQANLRIAMSATPVYTHARDLLAQGRLIRASSFIDARGAELARTINQLVTKGQKAWQTKSDQDTLKQFISVSAQKSRRDKDSSASLPSTSGTSTPTGSSASGDPIDALADLVVQYELAQGQGNNTYGYRAFWTTKNAMIRLRAALKGTIIRRDNRSLDIDGKPLLGLHQKVSVMAFCKLLDSVKEALGRQTQSAKQRDDARIDLKGFFHRYKKILVHALLEHTATSPGSTTDDAELMTIHQLLDKAFPSFEAYERNPSSKIDTLIKILRNHRGIDRCNAPPLYWTRMARKFVVYSHLSQTWTLVKHVLELAGFSTTHVNGKMSQAQRDESVQAFQRDDGPEVLILSDAGSVGLNLQRGSVAIYVDHPWSASDCDQIEGRLQRKGQEQRVYVYRLVVPDTPDEYLLGYANGKRLMMQLFTRECELRGLPGFEQEVFDVAVAGLRSSKPMAKNSEPRALKPGFVDPVATVEPADEPYDESETKPKPKPKPKPKKGPKPETKDWIDPAFPDLGPMPGTATRAARNAWLAKRERLRQERQDPDNVPDTSDPKKRTPAQKREAIEILMSLYAPKVADQSMSLEDVNRLFSLEFLATRTEEEFLNWIIEHPAGRQECDWNSRAAKGIYVNSPCSTNTSPSRSKERSPTPPPPPSQSRSRSRSRSCLPSPAPPDPSSPPNCRRRLSSAESPSPVPYYVGQRPRSQSQPADPNASPANAPNSAKRDEAALLEPNLGAHDPILDIPPRMESTPPASRSSRPHSTMRVPDSPPSSPNLRLSQEPLPEPRAPVPDTPTPVTHSTPRSNRLSSQPKHVLATQYPGLEDLSLHEDPPSVSAGSTVDLKTAHAQEISLSTQGPTPLPTQSSTQTQTQQTSYDQYEFSHAFSHFAPDSTTSLMGSDTTFDPSMLVSDVSINNDLRYAPPPLHPEDVAMEEIIAPNTAARDSDTMEGYEQGRTSTKHPRTSQDSADPSEPESQRPRLKDTKLHESDLDNFVGGIKAPYTQRLSPSPSPTPGLSTAPRDRERTLSSSGRGRSAFASKLLASKNSRQGLGSKKPRIPDDS